MDFGAREILILLGILVIVAILLDGIRRVSRARRGKLRTSSRRASRNTAIFDDDDEYPGELPGRGARVVQVRDERSAEEVSEKIRRECDYTRNKFTSPFKARNEQPAPDRDPAIFDDPVHSDAPAATDSEPPPTAPRQPEPFTASDAMPGDPPGRDAGDRQRMLPEEERAEPVEPPARQPVTARVSSGSDTAHGQSTTARSGSSKAQSSASATSQEDILILHLMAPRGQSFEGEKLLEQLLDHGLRYGAMRIFHCHEAPDGTGPAHFSVANSVNPGVFDLNIMDQFTTPGVTFIMPLDGLEKPLESFETLINTAVSMARKLDGELKDETRSAFTKQTIEHYRQRIIDFTRRSFTLTN